MEEIKIRMTNPALFHGILMYICEKVISGPQSIRQEQISPPSFYLCLIEYLISINRKVIFERGQYMGQEGLVLGLP